MGDIVSANNLPAGNVPLSRPRFSTIIFDLGDVLFTWEVPPSSPLSTKTLGRILRSAAWFEYEKGNLTEAEVYDQAGRDLDLSPADVQKAFHEARRTLKPNQILMDFIHELRRSGFFIVAMSNMSAPNWEFIQKQLTPDDWACFKHVFISATARERKPYQGFFQSVLDEAGIDPSRAIFVDDKVENNIAARAFGMHGIVFTDTADVIRQLKNLCWDPLSRSKAFLAAHKKPIWSFSSDGVVVPEIFAQYLIYELTGDRSLVNCEFETKVYNFFQGQPCLTTNTYPDDLDTTSLALTVIPDVDKEIAHLIMDKMLEFRDQDGILQLYFDHQRPRVDPAICCNILNCFYRYGRGHDVEPTFLWIEKVLINRAYISGTAYYTSAEVFLFFFSRLLQSSRAVMDRLGDAFRQRVVERFGLPGDPLVLATRILAAAAVGLKDKTDLDTLLGLQREDGSWRNGWMYRFGLSKILIGNDGLTTAFAQKAIEVASQLE